MRSATLAAPAAPTTGAAPAELPPQVALSRAQASYAEAREHWLRIRDEYYGPDRFRQLLQAARARLAAKVAFAAAAAVYHQGRYAATVRAARRSVCQPQPASKLVSTPLPPARWYPACLYATFRPWAVVRDLPAATTQAGGAGLYQQQAAPGAFLTYEDALAHATHLNKPL